MSVDTVKPLTNPMTMKIIASSAVPTGAETEKELQIANDAELAEGVLAAMRQIYRDGEMAALYERWFLKPLPGRTFGLDLKLNPLLNDNFRRPSSYVTDWAVL